MPGLRWGVLGILALLCAAVVVTQSGCSGGGAKPDAKAEGGADAPKAEAGADGVQGGDLAETAPVPDGGGADVGEAGSEAAGPPPDATADAPADAPLDAPADAPLDAPADSTKDAPADAATDTAAEVGAEAGLEAPAEALLLAPGAVCNAGPQCQSGQCVDGVCCGSPSCPQCQVCGAAGACVNTPRGTDDTTGTTCTGGNTCDGAGACKKKVGQTCGGDQECVAASCVASACLAPSCPGLAVTCGSAGNESCCKSALVPGDTYNRSNDPLYPATVSDFTLDRYEVTVGRYRKFVDAGRGTQAAGSAPTFGEGAHPRIFGSGWDTTWNSSLAASTAAMKTGLKCVGGTWTDTAGANENQPITCVTWYEAFAFCAWDGGRRLPTEAEWNFAAAGGREQRPYPWGSAPPDDTYAVYFPGSGNLPRNVGSKSPTGDGRWGHADLAGNATEWNLDWYVNPYPKPCLDCAYLVPRIPKVIRGGSYAVASSALPSGARGTVGPDGRGGHIGFRCAMSP